MEENKNNTKNIGRNSINSDKHENSPQKKLPPPILNPNIETDIKNKLNGKENIQNKIQNVNLNIPSLNINTTSKKNIIFPLQKNPNLNPNFAQNSSRNFKNSSNVPKMAIAYPLSKNNTNWMRQPLNRNSIQNFRQPLILTKYQNFNNRNSSNFIKNRPIYLNYSQKPVYSSNYYLHQRRTYPNVYRHPIYNSNLPRYSNLYQPRTNFRYSGKFFTFPKPQRSKKNQSKTRTRKPKTLKTNRTRRKARKRTNDQKNSSSGRSRTRKLISVKIDLPSEISDEEPFSHDKLIKLETEFFRKEKNIYKAENTSRIDRLTKIVDNNDKNNIGDDNEKSDRFNKNNEQKRLNEQNKIINDKPNSESFKNEGNIIISKMKEIQDENWTPCDICGVFSSAIADLIVYCDGCGVAVHKLCYGIEPIPKGDWFCAPCTAELAREALRDSSFKRASVKEKFAPKGKSVSKILAENEAFFRNDENCDKNGNLKIDNNLDEK
ncbi:hypothetical protein MHBO_000219, partial [Bonamia ostreae]